MNIFPPFYVVSITLKCSTYYMYCTYNFYLKGYGLDKRFNQTLQNTLMKFVSENENEWDAYLDTSIYAYNTSIHKSTSFSPFEVMSGRKAILPIDMKMSTKISAIDNEVSSTDIEMLAKQQQKLSATKA